MFPVASLGVNHLNRQEPESYVTRCTVGCHYDCAFIQLFRRAKSTCGGNRQEVSVQSLHRDDWNYLRRAN